MTGRVVALVLAAGRSSRLGRPKQLETVGDRSLVAHAVAAATAADDLLLLTGCEGERVEAAAPGARALRVVDWERGIGHVLACGVRQVGSSADAVVVLLADQPGVRADDVAALVARWRAGDGPLLTACYDGIPAHPRLFDAELFEQLEALDGDVGARDLVARTRAVAVETRGSPLDVDDEASLASARARAGADSVWP